jgi:hypothetical protein
MTLVRSGDRQQGLKEIEEGMKGIYDQSEYLTQAFRFTQGRFWDPKREIRSAIKSDLAMLSGKELDVQTILVNGEEEEIDLARRDQRDDLFRDGGMRTD